MEFRPRAKAEADARAHLDLGNVTNSSPAYRAVLSSDDYGVVMIGGAKAEVRPARGHVEGRQLRRSTPPRPAGTPLHAAEASYGNSPPAVTVDQGGNRPSFPSGAACGRCVTAAQGRGNRVSLRWRLSAPPASMHELLRQRTAGRRNRASSSRTKTARPFTRANSSMDEVSPAGTCGKYHPTLKASSRCPSN